MQTLLFHLDFLSIHWLLPGHFLVLSILVLLLLHDFLYIALKFPAKLSSNPQIQKYLGS